MNFNQMVADTLKFEGGQVTDSGGKTNRGVTQKTYDSYAQQNNLPPKSVDDLSYGEVVDMYKKEFLERPKYDKLPSEKLGAVVFDYGVNSGTPQATKSLQQIVGVKADGIIGNKTLKAVDKYIAKNGEDALVDAVMTNREDYMNSLIFENPAEFARNQNGWANRTKALRQKYLNTEYSPKVPPTTLGVRG